MNELLGHIENLLSYIEENGTSLNIPTQQLLMQFLGEVNDFVNAPIEATFPAGAGILWHIAGGNPEVFANYLGQVPDPALNAILNNPVQLQQIIRRLQENQPQERNRVIDGIPQAPIGSSTIYGYQYDPQDKKLYVRFQGDGIYEYSGVSPQIFQIFQSGAIPAKTEGSNDYGVWFRGKSPSLGSSFYELIKQHGYPHQKVA